MLIAILRSTHPGPAATVTLITVLLGLAAGLGPWRTALLGLAMALNQASVGLSNDWIDAERDRASGRRDKPVALGELRVGTARAVAIAAAAAAILVTIPLGPAATSLHALVLGSAWSYNAGLKRTRLSAAPYLVSFGLLPALVTLALPEPALAAWWAILAGALLGLAAHLANALPDLEDDLRTGVAGLPHRLPAPLAQLITWGALLGAAVTLAAGIGPDEPLAVAVLAASGVIAAIGLAAGLRGARRFGFRLVLLAALLDVALLVAAGARMVVR